MYGAGRSRITHPFATLTTKQSLMDPVRLACVKHAASVHPEPESNPPQKNLCRKPTCDPQKKETDIRLSGKRTVRKNPVPFDRPPGTHTPNTRGP